ncbi:MAG: SUMF1/EgtB/PvdO family nonheme iron enzyme [Clostridia bacterium]|nr:SUMF1/EgtB/PvdO family nonheme iron enzyme [Clostridia bacterium]
MNRFDLEQKFQKNCVIVDDLRKPSVMVYVKKFYLDEVIDGASHIPHPAFIVDGGELDGIYISKFQNVLVDGRAYSLPDKDPTTHVDFDAAIAACSSKGKGFHLMTAMEWGAIALWCQKNHMLPFGNNAMGKDIREEHRVARISYYDAEKSMCRTATGTGPIEWSHNRSTDGIYDLNANVWEWVGGMRLVFGELQILPNNDGASTSYSQSQSSLDWRAIDGTSGEFIIPDGKGTTPNSIKLDYINDKWVYLTDRVTSPVDSFRFCPFLDVTADSSICQKSKEILYALADLPYRDDEELKEVSLYANNGADERIAFRGGRWGQGLNSGIFKTCFDDPRSFSGDAVGFRSAYYANQHVAAV